MKNTIRPYALVVLLALALVPAAVAGPADGAVGEATKLFDSGTDTDRFDIVIVAEGYTADELSAFKTDAQNLMGRFLRTPPFATHCSTFNIWSIDVASSSAGADDPTDCADGTGATPDTFFDASFCADGLDRRLLSLDDASVLEVVGGKVPAWDQIVVLVNSGIDGGSGGNVVVASTGNAIWETTTIHEIGHSAFGLADEYDYFLGCGVDTDRDNHPDVEPVAANATVETDPTAIKWGALIDGTTPIPTTQNDDCSQCDDQENPFPGETVVGLYEGAHTYHCDGSRPAFDCMMRNLAPFCPVCSERILETLVPFMPANGAPECNAGGPYVAECEGGTTEVDLDGSGSSDPDCNELLFAWTGDFDEETAAGEEPTVTFTGLGSFGVDLEVSDGEASDECLAAVTVEDTLAPVVTAPENVVAECASPLGTPVELGEPVVEEVCDDAPTIENDAPALFALGDTPVEWVATDASGNAGADVQLVTVEDTIPPDLTAPATVQVECASPDGTMVDLGTPVVSDICDDAVLVTNDAPELFPLGSTTVTWKATDASDNSTTATQEVIVVDTTPPVLAFTLSPDELWPPNHQMELVTATVVTSDICDATVDVSLESITSNEPDNDIGDGNTDGDIQDGEYGGDDRQFQLRAERAGPGSDRVYTVTYTVSDDSDNQTTRHADVLVPHDQGQGNGNGNGPGENNGQAKGHDKRD